MRQRPISVTVFGILNIGYALFTFVGLLLQGFGTLLKQPGNSALAALKSDPVYRAWSQCSVVVGVVFGIALIASGIGLLLLQNWARVLAVIYSVLEMIFVLVFTVFCQRRMMEAIVAQIHGVPADFIGVIVTVILVMGVLTSLAYPVLLLIFMTRRKIIEAFNSPRAEEHH